MGYRILNTNHKKELLRGLWVTLNKVIPERNYLGADGYSLGSQHLERRSGLPVYVPNPNTAAAKQITQDHFG